MSEKPWYHLGLRFECAGCGGCCTGAPGYVWVNQAEVQALAATVGMTVPKFQKKYIRRVGIRRSLIELPGGDCVFFDSRTRTCRVYAVRPRQCRTWPFWKSNLRSPEAWQEMAYHCPGANCGPWIPLEAIQMRMDTLRV